jgi:hypothetical protein
MRSPNDSDWTEHNDAEIVDWKRVRSSIEHENTLTNHRLTWLLTSQGFLLGAFALLFQASGKNDVPPDFKPFYPSVLASIAFTGIMVSLYLRLGLRAAQMQHDRLRDWWEARPKTGLHPDICGRNFGWMTHKLPYHNFPFVFMIAWTLLMPVVFWPYLKPILGIVGMIAAVIVSMTGCVVLGLFLGKWMASQDNEADKRDD